MEETFKLRLDKGFFTKGDVLNNSYLVVSRPRKWFKSIWYRIANFFTAGKLCKAVGYKYKVKYLPTADKHENSK